MGAALAAAALEAGHEVIIVSGPVEVAYPCEAKVIPVVTTDEMLAACQSVFPDCNGLIAVAAPCDYRPVEVAQGKIHKTGDSLHVELVETPDIVATLGTEKQSQWIVAFALETHDRHLRAMQKLERKRCDLIVVNGAEAIHATDTAIEVLNKQGAVLKHLSGSKGQVAKRLFQVIDKQLISKPRD